MGFDCEQSLSLSGDFRRIQSELEMWAKIRRVPLHVVYELTPLCNLRCPMCYVRLDHRAMLQQGKLHSAEEWLEIGRQSAEMGTLFVTLSGGEPLLHPGFWEIYNGLTEMGMMVTIFTNGCLIDEAVIERFKANPPYEIKVSIYGASDETYETMCGVKDGFTRVSRAIDLLKEAELNFYCTSTAVRENVHDLEAMYRFAYEKGVKFFHTSAVALSARGALSDPLSSRTTAREEGWSLKTLETQKHPCDLAPFAYCGAYGINYFMTWHWHLSYCAFAPKPYAQVGDPVDLASAWEKLLEQTDKIRVPEECVSCEHGEFCKRCPGLLASESGDPEKVCETFCETARVLHSMYDQMKAEEAAKQAAQASEGEKESEKA